MSKRATMVFIPVPVSLLPEIEIALRKRSIAVSDAAEALYSHGDDNGYSANKEVQRKIDRVLFWVITKYERCVKSNGSVEKNV